MNIISLVNKLGKIVSILFVVSFVINFIYAGSVTSYMFPNEALLSANSNLDEWTKLFESNSLKVYLFIIMLAFLFSIKTLSSLRFYLAPKTGPLSRFQTMSSLKFTAIVISILLIIFISSFLFLYLLSPSLESLAYLLLDLYVGIPPILLFILPAYGALYVFDFLAKQPYFQNIGTFLGAFFLTVCFIVLTTHNYLFYMYRSQGEYHQDAGQHAIRTLNIFEKRAILNHKEEEIVLVKKKNARSN